jgi:hypothetical protein
MSVDNINKNNFYGEKLGIYSLFGILVVYVVGCYWGKIFDGLCSLITSFFRFEWLKYIFNSFEYFISFKWMSDFYLFLKDIFSGKIFKFSVYLLILIGGLVLFYLFGKNYGVE